MSDKNDQILDTTNTNNVEKKDNIESKDQEKTSTPMEDAAEQKTDTRKSFRRPSHPKKKFNNHVKSNLSFEVLVQRRVSTAREGGQKTSFSVLSVCGNKEGSIGLGMGKASDFSGATAKANNAAKKNMISIFKGEKTTTVFHNATVKKGGITLVITKAPSGQGLKCMATIEKMCRVAGITELSVKTHGSRNGLNVAKLFFQALKEQISVKQILAFKASAAKN